MMGWLRVFLGVATSMAMAAVACAQENATLLVTARLQNSAQAQVGATVQLDLQVMTPTWFTHPPQLPALNLSGAMVAPSSGQGVIVREQKDGVAYNGLRYTYVLSPTAPGTLHIPALTVSAKVGPSGNTVSASSQPFSFDVAAGTGDGPAANQITITQAYDLAPDPLVKGGRVTRSITQHAEGVQAMLLPAAPLNDVAGFKRYPREPEVKTLTDGRGGFVGGQRIDRADYVAQLTGELSLPTLTMRWRDSVSDKPHSQDLVGRTFTVAAAPVVDPPFSLAKDLTQLRHGLRWMPTSELLWSIGVLAVLLLLWLTRFGWRWGGRQVGRWIHTQRARRQASEAWHWRAWQREARRNITSLSAFYRWLRVASGANDVRMATKQFPACIRKATEAALQFAYGDREANRTWRRELIRISPQWRRVWRKQQRQASRYALPIKLNPHRKTRCTETCERHGGSS